MTFKSEFKLDEQNTSKVNILYNKSTSLSKSHIDKINIEYTKLTEKVIIRLLRMKDRESAKAIFFCFAVP